MKGQFEDQEVPLYEMDGRRFLTSHDIGICLGMMDPRKSVNKIFNKYRDELEPHSAVAKLATPSGKQATRLFDETGCNLISMFAQTPKAKAFRLWLARLPKQVRQLKEALPEALEEAERRGTKRGAAQASCQKTPAGGSMLEALEREFYHGVGHAIRIFVELNATRMDISRLLSVIRWRVLGLPQAEVAKMVGLSLFTMQKYEKMLREHGIVFPRQKELAPVSGYSIGKMLMQAYKERGRRGTGPYLKRIK